MKRDAQWRGGKTILRHQYCSSARIEENILKAPWDFCITYLRWTRFWNPEMSDEYKPTYTQQTTTSLNWVCCIWTVTLKAFKRTSWNWREVPAYFTTRINLELMFFYTKNVISKWEDIEGKKKWYFLFWSPKKKNTVDLLKRKLKKSEHHIILEVWTASA